MNVQVVQEADVNLRKALESRLDLDGLNGGWASMASALAAILLRDYDALWDEIKNRRLADLFLEEMKNTTTTTDPDVSFTPDLPSLRSADARSTYHRVPSAQIPHNASTSLGNALSMSLTSAMSPPPTKKSSARSSTGHLRSSRRGGRTTKAQSSSGAKITSSRPGPNTWLYLGTRGTLLIRRRGNRHPLM